MEARQGSRLNKQKLAKETRHKLSNRVKVRPLRSQPFYRLALRAIFSSKMRLISATVSGCAIR